MPRPDPRAAVRRLLIAGGLTAAMLLVGTAFLDSLSAAALVARLGWPLLRLLTFIALGLVAGQLLEASGWTRYLASLAAPVFRFSRLGPHAGAAFTTAFFSGVAANGMLLEFYREGRIARRQLFLANLVNQLPAYFLHLPTTFFIVVPLTGRAGLLYFALTFAATLLRTLAVLLFSRWFLAVAGGPVGCAEPPPDRAAIRPGRLGEAVRRRFGRRFAGVVVFVVPIYTLVFLLNAGGLFELARQALAQFVVTRVVPMESLSVVILSFAAEFTSGFAAAGALLEAGVLTVKQTVIALLAGNIVAFPIRALRHQLPRYMGIFAPTMGLQLLALGQGLRVASLILVGGAYLLAG